VIQAGRTVAVQNGLISDPASVKDEDEDISQEIRRWRCAGADHERFARLGNFLHGLPGQIARDQCFDH